MKIVLVPEDKSDKGYGQSLSCHFDILVSCCSPATSFLESEQPEHPSTPRKAPRLAELCPHILDTLTLT